MTSTDDLTSSPGENAMTRNAWTFDSIPDQTGRTAIVTGANTGIGLETARMLALKGADVVLACRTPEKAEAAAARIREEKPAGKVSIAALDLSDLESVKAFADSFSKSHARLDLLVLNAGVMVPPLSRTKQGFELQIGTNHLGHFALTGRLMPLVLRTAGARVVVVSSGVHHAGKIDFEDLSWEKRGYSPWAAYSQSKLANLLFALELQRRLPASSGVRVTAAHPGWTATDLQRTAGTARFFNPLFAMTPDRGALPTLRAATDPEAASGTYWGPQGLTEMNGPPGPARINRKAKDASVASRLFDVSEKLTGVTFSFAPAARTSSATAG
jgi:NAD(P)-dependent dehydrogenase (short-subunit alcohol dehydrogenase family)